MIEMVSAFGPLGILAYAETMHVAPWRDTSGHVAKTPGASRVPATAADTSGDVGQLISYVAERTEPTESAAALGIDELFADYLAWCRHRKIVALDQKQFGHAFDRLRTSPELEGKIKKFGSRYFGIALAAGSEKRNRAESVA